MTPEQQSAFIVAQAVCVNAMIAAMQAENALNLRAERAPSYAPADFEALILQYGIGHNDVLAYFRGHR